jgi:hypothetical protein
LGEEAAVDAEDGVSVNLQMHVRGPMKDGELEEIFKGHVGRITSKMSPAEGIPRPDS